ncbi:hypothetical protein [Acuticoccus mangrovi]|uniref:Uncharacterized protein n=1 Tax=Acuticoccus mangrovi TaxID=2796142 RepID=A0A934IG91_9HYPH|nr:hypothetical protein [Acuticoccus mangrovi]MBJ3776119.1 hypothetical protein [Acuticoccus mangrovi]
MRWITSTSLDETTDQFWALRRTFAPLAHVIRRFVGIDDPLYAYEPLDDDQLADIGLARQDIVAARDAADPRGTLAHGYASRRDEIAAALAALIRGRTARSH